jgi:hypothetical protein
MQAIAPFVASGNLQDQLLEKRLTERMESLEKKMANKVELLEKEYKQRIGLLEDEISFLKKTMIAEPVAIRSTEVSNKRVVREEAVVAETSATPPKKMRPQILDAEGKFTDDYDGQVLELLEKNLHQGSIQKIQPKLEQELRELFGVAPDAVFPVAEHKEVMQKLEGKRDRLLKHLKKVATPIINTVCLGNSEFYYNFVAEACRRTSHHGFGISVSEKSRD